MVDVEVVVEELSVVKGRVVVEVVVDVVVVVLAQTPPAPSTLESAQCNPEAHTVAN